MITTITNLNAQVGIGTLTPDPSSMLHIDNGEGNKGILIPQVALSASNIGSPITPAPAVGLLVYNTATAGSGGTAVIPGYHFWSGTEWMDIMQNNDKWDLSGNWNTDEDSDYLGTNDAQSLMFRTHHIERFKVANGYQVLAMGNGSPNAPFYSWNQDKTMGFWKSGHQKMGMAINGSVFFNASANTSGGSDIELSINPEGENINLRVETSNNENTLFVDGEHDNIGLGTGTPDPSSQMEMTATDKGFLMNRVGLTATNVSSPITSPAEGLMVYNTNNTATGANDVYKGFYMWDGSNWIAQFPKMHSKVYQQDAAPPLGFRTISTSGWQDIPGLTNQSFTAKYSGTYKLEVTTNFGGGYMEPASDNKDKINIASQEGEFKFTFDGNDHMIYSNSYSVHNKLIGGSGGTNYYAIWYQSSLILYLQVVGGTTYNFNLAFDQFDSPGFVDNGNSGTGMGHVGVDIPCYTEFTFLGDN